MTMQPLKTPVATRARKHAPKGNAASKPVRSRHSTHAKRPATRFGALRRVTTIVDASDDLLSAGEGWSVE